MAKGYHVRYGTSYGGKFNTATYTFKSREAAQDYVRAGKLKGKSGLANIVVRKPPKPKSPKRRRRFISTGEYAPTSGLYLDNAWDAAQEKAGSYDETEPERFIIQTTWEPGNE